MGAPVPGAEWRVRALTGADEWRVHEANSAGATPAAGTTALLSALATRAGAAVGPDVIRALGIGTRERLLIEAYRATFGPLLDLVARCPACAELTEIAVAVGDVLAPPSSGEGEGACVVDAMTVLVRIATGADHERVAGMAAANAGRAARELIAACILEVRDAAGAAIKPAEVHDRVAGEVEATLRRIDPDADIGATIECPACEARFRATLDGHALIAGAITPEAALFAEVDMLARAYGWREADILAIPLLRRRRYLELAATRIAA